MLQGTTIACPPAALISAAACSQTGALREETTTLAPDRARCMAIALPMPLLEPVTTATLPVRSKSGDAILVSSENAPATLPIQMGRCQRLTLTEGSEANPRLRLMTPPSRITATPPHLNGEESEGSFLGIIVAAQAGRIGMQA